MSKLSELQCLETYVLINVDELKKTIFDRISWSKHNLSDNFTNLVLPLGVTKRAGKVSSTHT